MIDVRRLRALRELAQHGTIAAAADALHLTPSGVSQQLSALEREVGQRLIEPRGRGVRLTPAAHLLLDHAGALFAQLERLHADLDAHANGGSGTVRVAGFPTALAGIVAPAAEMLARSAPEVRLVVSEAEAPEVYDMLSAGVVDVAIAMEGDRAPRRGDARFARVELQRDILDLALRADHALAKRERIRLSDLALDAWIAPPVGWQCESVMLAACRAAGFAPDAVHRTSDWGATLQLVGAGLGVALVPRLAVAAAHEGVVLRPVAGEPPCRHIFAACRAGSDAAPAMRRLLEALAQAAVIERMAVAA